MDLRTYYQRIRALEAEFEDEFPIVVSGKTGDGGRAGVASETTRAIAAKMIADGLGRLATAEEADSFRQRQAEDRRIAEQRRSGIRLQVSEPARGKD